MPEGQPKFTPDARDVDAPPIPPFGGIQEVAGSFLEMSKQSSVETEQADSKVNPESSNTPALKALRAASIPVANTLPSNLTQVNTPQEKLRGFRQDPLRVLRNTFLYPTAETNMQIVVGSVGMVGLSSLVASALGHPELAVTVTSAAEVLLAGEFVSLFARRKGLSGFLQVNRNRVTEEKVLTDGTKIGLDDTVGELSISSFTKLWRMRFKKDRTKRALTVASGVLEGLVNLANKSETDPWFQNFTAFKGTSHIVNPRIAEKFGFQVEKPRAGYASTVLHYIRNFNRVITLMPKDVGNQEIHIAWISKEGLISHKKTIQEELDKVNRALTRRK